MSKEIKHSHIQDPSLTHQPFHYQQANDPGAVGAGIWWLEFVAIDFWAVGVWADGVWGDIWGGGTSGRLHWRNDADDGWITI